MVQFGWLLITESTDTLKEKPSKIILVGSEKTSSFTCPNNNIQGLFCGSWLNYILYRLPSYLLYGITNYNTCGKNMRNIVMSK